MSIWGSTNLPEQVPSWQIVGPVAGTATESWAQKACHYCGALHAGVCPRVRTIEYYANGTVKRVEFFEKPMGK